MVIFGDPGKISRGDLVCSSANSPPDSSEAVTGVASSKTDIICHAGDDICIDGDLVLPAHLTYAINAASAAAFVVSH